MGKGILYTFLNKNSQKLTLKSLFLLIFVTITGAAWAEGDLGGRVTVTVSPDSVRVLRNPLSGWVMYLGRAWDENFWAERGYDSMPAGDTVVRVSDYATTAYLRTSWSSLEPEEGKYAWNDPDSRLARLLSSVARRGLRLAFRIVVDGRDQGQNTPMYVFEAGAKGFSDPSMPGVLSPYPDDPVFQAKYEKFITAFAAEFNDPGRVEFIDAFGLGKWGEAHGLRYADYGNKAAVFDWITSLYAREFTGVPIVINYHRLVADTMSWAPAHPDSERLLESAVGKGYSLRHDAFGMTGYYREWERDFAARWRHRLPIIFEGGWITGAHHRYWIDPSGAYRQGHSEDVRRGEYEAAREAAVNMMDLRTGDEVTSWFGTSFDLVKAFIAEGGYRLYPSAVTLPAGARAGATVTIDHTWENMGWGYCPTNIPQMEQRYKVAFALIAAGGRVALRQVDTATDLSTWLKGAPTSYTTTIETATLPPGRYTWAVAIVDTATGEPGIEMAVDPATLIGGWLPLGAIMIEN